MAFALAALGLAILLVAGDLLVRGAVNLSLRLGIPALLVSLTIVAFGTSAPELLVSVQAVLNNAPGLALGNVVGSNIANVLLVLGIPALISRIGDGGNSRASYLVMLGATGLFLGLALTGVIGRWQGLILLVALALILLQQGFAAKQHRDAQVEIEGADPSISRRKIALFIVLGLLGLPLGANLLVNGATVIAQRFGISDAVIGLTLVAVGTSLPELATTIVAAIRRQTDVVMGNVIGSNMFNLLGILGLASLVRPIPVDADFLRFDLWVMLGTSLLLAPFVLWRGPNLTRRWGALFVLLYGVYVWSLVA